MSASENPHFEKIVQRMADGEAVDWDSTSGDSVERHPALQGLRVVEKLFHLARAERRALADVTGGEAEGPRPGDTIRPTAPPLPEAILATWGSLQLIEKIGEGSYGEVFRAHDPALQIDVALKLWFPRWSSTPDVESFLKEARTLARVRHPNVVAVLGAANQDDRVGMWTELLTGQTLEDSLRSRGRYGAAEAAVIGAELCRALAAVHAAGLVHRDVKTRNIMRVEGGRIVLMDFGSVTQMNRLTPAAPEPFPVGTPLTMAPEQFTGQRVGPSADLYALGVLLYRLTSNHYPIEAPTLEELIERHRRSERTPLRDWAPELSPDFVEIVERAIAPEPAERYSSAGAFEQALLRFVQSEGRASAPAGAGEPPASAGARNEPPGARVAAAGERRAGASSSADRGRDRRGARPWIESLVGAFTATVPLERLLRPGPPWVNPQVTVTTLELPFSRIQYPGMSPDGKWLALPASDGRGRWCLYFMNVKGGGPREIVSELSTAIAYADISPDGSQIAYNVRIGNRDELRVVPVLGGPSTFVVENASGPHWRPDGERIGYQLPGDETQSGQLELWSVRPDGSDRRLEYEDEHCTGGNRYSFSWSPDCKTIAWVRSFDDERFQEIIVRDLARGRERQLTHDEKNIDEVCWTRQNEIVFSSNRGGSMNLWSIRAAGGSPAQVTKGPGPDLGMRVSADGKTMLCLQRHLSYHVWIGDLERGLSYQVTHDDLSLITAALSPDHQRLVVTARDPNLQSKGHVMIMERDGSGRRSLTGGGFTPLTAEWSPAGNLIAFTAIKDGIDLDSSSVYVMDPNTPGSERRLGRGAGARWLDERTLYVHRLRSSCLMSVRDGQESFHSPDSTWALPLPTGLIFETDIRPGHEGHWVRELGTPLGDVATRRLLGPLSLRRVDVTSDGTHMLYLDEKGGFFRLDLASGVPEQVPGNFNGLTLHEAGVFYGLTLQSLGRVTPDSREFVYLEPSASSRLLLIENVK